MKKLSLAVGLVATLGISNLTFADGWDYSKHNSREALIFSGTSEKPTMSADTSSQNSKAAVLAVNAGKAKEVGKTTIVYSDRGGQTRTAEISVTK